VGIFLKKYSIFFMMLTLPILSGCESFEYTHGGGGYWGGWALGGGRSCGAGCHNENVLNSFEALSLGGAYSPGILLAHDYDIRLDSAERILRVASGHFSPQALKRAGLRYQDVKFFKKRVMPPAEVIQRIASTLGEESWKIRSLIERFLSEIQS
jgi:hypothetical protein